MTNKTLEVLKKRFLNSDFIGRQLIGEVLRNVASTLGCEKEILDWMHNIETGKNIGQEEEIEIAPEPKVPEEEEKVEEPEKEPEEEPEEPEREEEPELKVTPEEKEPHELEEVNEIKDMELKEAISEISKRLKALSDRFDDIEDAVSQHKRILEKLLRSPEQLEEKKKELQRKDLVTPTEFGLRFYSEDPNVNTEDLKTFANLKKIRRNAMAEEKEKKEDPTLRRKFRLSKVKAQEERKTLRDEFQIDKGLEEWKKLKQIPPTPYTTKEQLETRKEREKKPLWLQNLTAEFRDKENAWILAYEGKPLFRVVYSKDLASSPEVFAERSFGKMLLKDFIQKGEDIFIDKYHAEILGEEEKEDKEKKKKPEVEQIEGFETKFLRAFELAKKIMDKNLIEHPLKSAFYEELRKLGVSRPVGIIENAFKVGSEKFFNTLLALTKKYMDMDAKTFAEVEAFVNEAKTQIFAENEDEEKKKKEQEEKEGMSWMDRYTAEELRRRAVSGSIPIVSESGSIDPLKEAIPKPQNWSAVKK